MKHFVEQHANYESAACSPLGDDSSVEESQQYRGLLERIQDLYGQILQRNATMKKMWPCEQKGIMNY
ncbi:hypothetical protein MRX96_040100 [Rhipicephalus microplus]